MMSRAVAPLLCAVGAADAHFSMITPPTWLDADGSLQATPTKPGQLPAWRGAGCTGRHAPGEVEAAEGCIAEWYTNWTHIPGAATIPDGSPLVTYSNACAFGGGCDWTKTMPWRAPGTAPVFSPCGVDGGNRDGCPVGNAGGDGCAAGGYGHGPDGRSLKGNTRPAAWQAGGVAEASWGVTANHGGGYQYRLCPKPASYADLTEECFQQTPLDFVGDSSWVQYGTDSANRTAFPALRTSTGTFPKGSQWTRNPIPACKNAQGQPFAGGADSVCTSPMFPPPADGLWGFWGVSGLAPGAYPEGKRLFDARIVDKLQIPAGISAGDYVLSFRFDCEQTPQVWQQCADVRIS